MIFFGLDEMEFEKVVNNTFVDQWWIFCIMKILQNPFILQQNFFLVNMIKRADSAQQCIALLTGNEKSTVRSGKLIELQRNQ